MVLALCDPLLLFVFLVLLLISPLDLLVEVVVGLVEDTHMVSQELPVLVVLLVLLVLLVVVAKCK
jgi:hypothetical protein